MHATASGWAKRGRTTFITSHRISGSCYTRQERKLPKMRLLQHRAKVSERVAWENKLWLARPDACCVKGAPEDQSGATAADRKRRRQFQSVMGVTVTRYNDGLRQRQTDAGGKAERVLCT